MRRFVDGSQTMSWGTDNTLVTLDGRSLHLRQAVEDDALGFIQAMDVIAREGLYFLRSRFEVDEKKQCAFIAGARDRGDLILLAVDDMGEGRIVGWVSIFRARAEFLQHTAELGMGVVPDYRGIGLGTALIDRSLRWAAGQKIEKVKLGVRAGNERARALYEKFGFVKEGRRVRDIKDQHGHYDDIIEMSFFISGAQPASAEDNAEAA